MSSDRPEAFNQKTFQKGLDVRKKVLGADHVQKSLDAASDFTRDMQEFVTEYCWGAIWGRPGLDLRTRSMLNIGMLTALNRSHELAVHVRGAINNGVTEGEMKEIILQAAVYCGMPAGLESLRIAEKAINELRSDE
jgi:4-carboxymuconolactone decarboxylase